MHARQRLNTKDNLLATGYLLIFLGALMLSQFLILPMRVAQLCMLSIGAFTIQFYKKNTPNHYLLTFYIIYTVFGLFSWVFNRNAEIQEYLWIIAFGGIALMLSNRIIIFNYMRVFYYGAMLSMCLLILFNNGVDNLHMASSRNAISSIGILLLSLYMISAYQSKRKVHIMAPIIFVITSLLGIGRSGVLLAAGILCVFLIWDVNRDTFKMKRPLYICITIIAVCFLSILLYESVIYPAIYNIGWRGLISQSRLIIWGDYIKKVFSDPMNLLYGAHISGTVYLDKYSQNLHNSFLNLHSKYGLFILILIVILTINSLKYLYKKKKMILLIPFLAIIFRAQTDYTNFNGTADLVWYYFIFLPFFEKRMVYFDRSFRGND